MVEYLTIVTLCIIGRFLCCHLYYIIIYLVLINEQTWLRHTLFKVINKKKLSKNWEIKLLIKFQLRETPIFQARVHRCISSALYSSMFVSLTFSRFNHRSGRYEDRPGRYEFCRAIPFKHVNLVNYEEELIPEQYKDRPGRYEICRADLPIFAYIPFPF